MSNISNEQAAVLEIIVTLLLRIFVTVAVVGVWVYASIAFVDHPEAWGAPLERAGWAAGMQAMFGATLYVIMPFLFPSAKKKKK